VGLLGLVVSASLVAYVWHSALTRGRYSMMAAIMGPMTLVIALAAIVHGDALSLARVTPRLRIYGIVGSLCSTLNLYHLGFFTHENTIASAFAIGLPVVMIGLWLLPARVLEAYSPPRD
jgi:hypothetical protein